MIFPKVSALVGVTAKSMIWGVPRLASADETEVGEGRGGGRVAAGGRRVGVSVKVGTDAGEASGDENVGVTLGGLEVGVNVGGLGVAVMVGAVVTTTSIGPVVGVDGSGWLALVRHAASMIAASILITIRTLTSWYGY